MAKGLLLVMMEPASALEEEFNDWYDTEHFPQRRSLPGFESASRWVCLDGWPRWIALYDMVDTRAVETPEYAAVSGANATPWSRRVLPRTVGRERIVCRQVRPGSALGRAPGEVTRLVAARYPRALGEAALTALQAQAETLPGLIQIRAFATTSGSDENRETWAVAEYDRVQVSDRVRGAFGEAGGIGARLVNLYAPYVRGPRA